MKQIVDRILQLLGISFMVLIFCSNAAQPGVWNAGGGGFNLLFPEDSSAFGKIQMESEAIAIQLYPGFAVVKGTYRMRNQTSERIVIKVGYPIEGIYDTEQRTERNEISFDGLYQLQVFQDGKARSIIEEPVKSRQPQTQTFDNDNWYIWESVFPPNASTEINVYFMVNTNVAKITEGYARDRHNAFIYILESGRIWQQPINEAVFKVQLMDGLKLDNIHGISQRIDFQAVPNRDLLFGKKLTFTPMPEDNLLVNYGEHREDFDFVAQAKQSAAYFSAVDQLADLVIDETTLLPYEEADPYIVHQVNLISWFWQLLILIPVFLGLLVVYGVYRAWRRRRK